MFFGRTDKLPTPKEEMFKRITIAVLLGGFLLFWLIVMVNRVVASEETIKSEFVKRDIKVGRHGNTSDYYFKGQTGRQYKIKVRHTRKLSKMGPLKVGQTVELKLRKGIFWTEIIEIRNGGNVYKKD